MGKKRSSGILMPVASLPGKYGIGTFSKQAFKFIDDLKEAGQKYWQILPLGPTGYGDSPYQSFSTFAGNPYFIDLEELIKEGLLKKAETEKFDFGKDERYIDYEKIYLSRFKVLRLAFERSDIEKDKSYKQFVKENAYWLDDYALYMAVKNSFNGVSFLEWDEDIRIRKPEVLKKYREKYSEDIKFYCFQQYLFMKQWLKLKKYANDSGIKIIGDIPIYVSPDGADTWAHPELFQVDEKGYPIEVAGCPPDAFSADGQLWGNPLYKWDYHKETGYKWWLDRIAYCFKLYDVVRVDHFRGFDSYYAIPYGEKTAKNGRWVKGPGYDLFKTIKTVLGDKEIIAEDLGFLTRSVRSLVKKTGYPSMKVIQFAFDPREESDYLPHNYTRNTVAYTGTHDNDTLLGWYKTLKREDKRFALNYMNAGKRTPKDINWAFIRLTMRSVSDYCIIPIQDYLGLSSEARINRPSTLGGNWTWRMKEGEFSPDIQKKVFEITKLYGRL